MPLLRQWTSASNVCVVTQSQRAALALLFAPQLLGGFPCDAGGASNGLG